VRLLVELLAALHAEGRQVALSNVARHSLLLRSLEATRAQNPPLHVPLFEEYDLALEWCENGLLRTEGVGLEEREELPLSKHGLLENLSPDQVEVLAALMERRSFPARQLVVRRGEVANELFLLVQGELSVLTDTTDGRLRRLSTLTAGMGFGEPSMVEGSLRSAYVRADVPAVCWVLTRTAFDSLDVSHPELKIRLLENLLRSATQTLGRLSFEALAERM